MEIKVRSLDKLTRWEAFQFLKDALNFAEAAKNEKPELYLTHLGLVNNKFNAFDDALMQESNSESSKEIAEGDEARDYGVRKLYAMVDEFADYRFDDAKAAAGKALLLVFKPYGTGSEIANMRQNDETAKISNLLQDLSKDTNKPHLELLGLTEIVEFINKNNSIFTEAKHSQTTEKSQRIVGLVKSTRLEALQAFNNFCKSVNALAIVEGEAKYTVLIGQLNTLIEDYLSKLSLRKKKDAGEEEE